MFFFFDDIHTEPTTNKEAVLIETPQDNIAVETAVKGIAETSGFFSVHVTKGKITDDDHVQNIGVFQIPLGTSFAGVRAQLQQQQELAMADFLFSIPSYGVISARQEIDLGSASKYLSKSDLDTADYNLLVVEPF